VTHYVVEFRLPVEIDSDSPKEAAMMARRRLEEQTGLDIGSWYTRVFEYGETENEIGVIGEYFFSPGGIGIREISQNLDKHKEIIKNGTDSDDS
jgi:8-oxo-dGTP pyrophosphatase MutT (NUDIX family)